MVTKNAHIRVTEYYRVSLSLLRIANMAEYQYRIVNTDKTTYTSATVVSSSISLWRSKVSK